MRDLYEEYGLMVMTFVVGIILLVAIIGVFYAANSIMASLANAYTGGLIR